MSFLSYNIGSRWKVAPQHYQPQKPKWNRTSKQPLNPKLAPPLQEKFQNAIDLTLKRTNWNTKKSKYAKKKNNKPIQNTLICSHTVSHEEKGMNGLSEEQDAHYLKNGYLRDTRCSACRKIVVSKTKLYIEESSNETIFNIKCFFCLWEF